MNKFELKGVWCLPENPNRTVIGILRFDPRTGGYLELMGSFKDISKINEVLEPHIIWGMTFDGKILTLYKCIEARSTFSSPGILMTDFYVHIIFIGVNFSSLPSIKFKGISVCFSYLDEWIGLSGFERTRSHEGSYEIKYKLPGVLNYNISTKLSVKLLARVDYQESKRNHRGLPKVVHIDRSKILFQDHIL